MNYGIFTGRICAVPSVSIIQTANIKQLFICKFVICTKEIVRDEIKRDYFECVAFESTAKAVKDGFLKGAKINVFGKIKNFIFKDANDTAHFTNIVLAEHIEYGDSVSENASEAEHKLPIIAELLEMDKLYEEVCRSGFLCIDENDYYHIAVNNVDISDVSEK